MKKVAKEVVSLRLTRETKDDLKSLANRYNVSQAQIITVLTHLFRVYDEVPTDEAIHMLDIMSKT